MEAIRTVRIVLKGEQEKVYLAIEKLAEYTNELEKELQLEIEID